MDRERRLLRGREAPFAEGDPVLVRQRICERAREQVSRGLRWMLRDAEVERLVNVAIDVGELDLDAVDGRGESHAARRPGYQFFAQRFRKIFDNAAGGEAMP